jgi:hypothetical protein
MKYTSDVTMKVTKEQFENDLKPSLIQMGRHDNTWGGWIEHPYVAVTSKNNKVGNYRGVDYPEYCIDHYNPELFLALAAMTDSENGNVGEYWKFIDTDYIGGNFTRGKIYKQDKSTINIYEAFIDNKGVGNGLSTSKGGNKSCFIKATKEEIITHFSKKILNNMKKLPEQFSVYARTKEEAVYICEKQKEMCGSTFSTPEKYMFYRFSPNKTYDKWGYNSTSYIIYPSRLSEYNIQHEFTFEEFKSYFEEVNNKVCFKSDGTINTGIKIINELERLGGKNIGKFDGNSDGRYYYINDVGSVSMEFDIPKGYELVSLNKEIKMKNRILTPVNATRIINIACSKWKPKLAEKWATNIVLNKDTEISEEFYKEMRKACTSEQNTLFDEIFGSDEQLIKISDLEIGEAMKIYDSNTRWDGIIISRIWSNDKPRYVNMNDRSITWDGSPTFKGKKVKLTITHEEIN